MAPEEVIAPVESGEPVAAAAEPTDQPAAEPQSSQSEMLLSDYTRKTQEIAQQKAEIKQAVQMLGTDFDQAIQVLAKHGLEVPDLNNQEPEFDPSEHENPEVAALKHEIAQLQSRVDQTDQRFQQTDFETNVSRLMDNVIEASGQNPADGKLTPRQEAIFWMATALPEAEGGGYNVAGAKSALDSVIDAEVKSQVDAKLAEYRDSKPDPQLGPGAAASGVATGKADTSVQAGVELLQGLRRKVGG